MKTKKVDTSKKAIEKYCREIMGIVNVDWSDDEFTEGIINLILQEAHENE